MHVLHRNLPDVLFRLDELEELAQNVYRFLGESDL